MKERRLDEKQSRKAVGTPPNYLFYANPFKCKTRMPHFNLTFFLLAVKERRLVRKNVDKENILLFRLLI